jgi:hypothetical protein
LFCFVRDTLDEIDVVVKDTLLSYIQNFYSVKEVKITTKVTLVEESPLPIEELVPISRVKPSLEYA